MKPLPTFISLFLLLPLPSVAQNVIVLVIDGARYSETFESGATYTPHMWNDLRPLGAAFASFRNDGVTFTNPGHASIESGTWQSIPNDGTQRPTMPTVFEYYRKQSGAPESECYAVVGKAKLDVLTYSTHQDYGVSYKSGFSLATDDQSVFDSLLAVMGSRRPRLMVVNFPSVDLAGHAGDWNVYLSAIRKVDSLVAEVWGAVQSDPFYADSTTMFVTNDHGRHDDAHGGFQNHGDACEGCRRIMLLVLGRRIPAGISIVDTSSQIDLAPTMAELLGFSTPFAIGTSLFEKGLTTSPDQRELIPSRFFLYQNYPNPFNPETRIKFEIETRSWVVVTVANVLGQELARLVEGELEAGSHEVFWNGEGHPTGIYFYRLAISDLKGESKSTARKMILEK